MLARRVCTYLLTISDAIALSQEEIMWAIRKEIVQQVLPMEIDVSAAVV
jgi:hypothetical protein